MIHQHAERLAALGFGESSQTRGCRRRTEAIKIVWSSPGGKEMLHYSHRTSGYRGEATLPRRSASAERVRLAQALWQATPLSA
ncbi:MAG: hypothetical protein HY791_34745 [Deltaproteobacteria bacterium]|nr:hypothetical protein [Deltaproteobacteria bacterium]